MNFKLFDEFSALHKIPFNDKFRELYNVASKANGEFLSARAAATGDVDLALKALNGEAVAKHDAWAKLAKDASGYDEAKVAADKARDALKDFLRGKTEYALGDGKTVKLTDTVGKEVRDAFIGAEEASAKIVGPANGMFGALRTQKEGFTAALKQNGKNMNFWKEGLEFGQRAKAFAHGSAAVGSAVLVGDALFRGKNSDGEDRTASSRILEAVAGGLVGTAALLGGPAAMAR